ncbi:hypothetical protein AX15_004941 [Amanita polypyramis BW_CC]|nr:hypothetical protein AX15_004941 [Amanita polypyramis BW_CC]
MTTLPLFWHLSSASKKERINASVKLIGALEQFQTKFVPKESPSTSTSDAEQEDNSPAQKTDLLDAMNAQDVSYSIRRLIRGLSSPRESSRLGFAVALTELLSRINTITCAQIVSLILDGTKIQGSMTGQEERDMLFARLFGFTSVIESGLLVRTGALPTSPSTAPQISTLSSVEEVVKGLFALGEKKSWLRESSWWTIILALDTIHDSEVEWKQEAIDFILQHLFIENQVWSPEKVALTFKLQEKYPSREWTRYLSPPFKNSSLLHSSNLQTLAVVLKEAGTHDDDDDDDKDMARAPAGAWKPELHFVWDVILDRYLPNTTLHIAENNFQEFYRIVVDESLFASTSSPKRKHWGFQVFKKALPWVTQTSMPMLFTRNFMRCWINQLSNHDRHLHKIARQAALDVQTFVQNNPQLGFSLILQLTGIHGHQQFDRLTKTKTVESILTAMDEPEIKNYINYLYSQFNVPENADGLDVTALKSRRTWVIDQLAALIRNPSVPKSDKWIKSVLDWLTVYGLFDVRKKSSKSPFDPLRSTPQPALPDELCQTCRNRLLASLGDLSSQTVVIKTGERSARATGVASDGQFWISKVLKTIGQLEADAKHVTLRAKPSSVARGLHAKAGEALSRLGEAEWRDTAQGAELLLSATLLQSYCNTDLKEGTEELEACIDSVDRLFASGGEGKERSRGVADEETSPEPIDLLVDLIIGFMEKSTAYLRTIGNQAFALLSGTVKGSTIDLILTQLERRDPSELMNGADSSDVEMDDDESGHESESEDKDSSVDSDKGEDEDSPSDEDESENDEDVDPELRSKVEKALRSILPVTEDGSESENSMDDEQMMAIDKQLADILRSHVGSKRKSVDAQREATHFKNRVLDLVDTFIRRQPESALILRLIIPLIELISVAGPDERQLADKARGILRIRLGKSKEIPSNVDSDSCKPVLSAVHSRARKTHSSELLPLLSRCSIYLSRVMVHCDAEDKLLAAYRESLTDFLMRKNSALNASFFQEFIQRFPSTGWHLRDDLLSLSAKAVNIYRQCQAFHLVEVLLNSLPYGDTQVDLAEFISKLSRALIALVESACDDTVSLSAAQIKQLFRLALSAIRQINRREKADADTWNASSWVSLRAKLQTSTRYKSSPALLKMCDQIIRSSQSEQRDGKIGGSKRKAGGVNEEQNALKSNRTKRKKLDKSS